ncbi:MAG: hypothetical protein ABSG53_33620, partial [Thermoguttaceae bacterium]
MTASVIFNAPPGVPYQNWKILKARALPWFVCGCRKYVRARIARCAMLSPKDYSENAGFRNSEPGLVIYPYGGSATRVPLRSDTNKVVVPFFQALFQHRVEFVILKRRASEQENAGKMTVHIRLYTPI